jgi:hypothetical protein
LDAVEALGTLALFELRRPAPALQVDLGPLATSVALSAKAVLPEGATVGVAVGSRGISRLGEVVAATVEGLRQAGVGPVLVPAMGSHGGATPEGQVEVLRQLGVRPEEIGVPIEASMEVEEVGCLARGLPVFVAKAALGLDALVPVGRVKPHTDFRAPVESGLTKMLTIGIGKEAGASSLHSAGFGAFAEVLPEALGIVLRSLRVPFGVALVEDAWHRLCKWEVVAGEQILERDEALLKEAWGNFAALPFAELDLLVVKEMGKTVSGAGMDPNVTGRFPNDPLLAPTQVARLVVLDLRDDSEGNAIGVGVADVVTERLRSKVSWPATYANAMASKSLPGARLPMVAPADADAVKLALASLVGVGSRPPRVAAISNTLEVNHLAVTEALVREARAAGYELLAGPIAPRFSNDGTLEAIGGLEFFPAGRN